MRAPALAIAILLSAAGSWTGAAAQTPSRATPADTAAAPDTTRPDTTRPDTTASGSAAVGDTTEDGRRARPDTASARGAGSRREPEAGRPSSAESGPGAGSAPNAVRMSARDSLVIRTAPDTSDRATLYGNSEASYEQATLKAHVIALDLGSLVMEATGGPEQGPSGRPVCQQGGSGGGSGGGGSGGGGSGGGFTGEALQYNLRTKRGRVETARTGQRQGYVEGETVKVYEDSTFFVSDGVYTTCDCPPGETPSYSLRSSQMKLQDQWVYTGPIQLFLFNIPTPLWLPFGFLPNTSGRRSGPLPPQYGQDDQRGLYLKDWGWYFALNDYTDLQIRAGLYSRGSFWVEPRFRYRKRYTYSGNARLRFERFQTGEEQDPGFRRRYEGNLRWTHRQEINPTSSFDADVDLQTSNDFNRRNSESYEDNVKQRIGSSISYRKSWPGGSQSLNVSASHDQTLTNGTVRLTLPQLSFNQGDLQPFARESRIGDERWYEKITTSYNLSIRNNYNFRPRDPERLRQQGDSTLARRLEEADVQWYEALFDRDKYELATGNQELYDFEAEHRIPVNTRFRVNRFNLNVTPNANYESTWHVSTRRLSVNRDTTFTDDGEIDRIRDEQVEEVTPGFFAERRFSVGVNTSTEAFGTFPLAVGPFEGLRHRIRPNLSFRYSPNFNASFWGQTRVLRDSLGNPVRTADGRVQRYDIVDGRTVSGSSEQRTLSFGVDNDLETKRVSVDSTGERSSRNIRLLTFGASSSYNFVADQFKLSDIRADASTRYDRFNFQSTFTFSPYQFERDTTGAFRRVDRYLAAERPWLPVRLTRFSFNMSGSFEGEETPGRGRGRSTGGSAERGRPASGSRGRGAGSQRRQGYVDYRIPWTLSFRFNYSVRKPFDRVESQSASLNGSFGLRITPKWKIDVRSGYDFIRRELVTTRIDVYRDLGCWEMAFTWVPFGRNQSYGFNLQVKSGRLSQLLRLNIPRSGEGRLGGIGNQVGGALGGAVQGRGGGLGGLR